MVAKDWQKFQEFRSLLLLIQVHLTVQEGRMEGNVLVYVKLCAKKHKNP